MWERSFPDLGGFVLELADVTGRSQHVRLRRREAAAQRRANEARWENLADDFARASLEPVVIDSSEESEILRAFLDWAETRQEGGSGAW